MTGERRPRPGCRGSSRCAASSVAAARLGGRGGDENTPLTALRGQLHCRPGPGTRLSRTQAPDTGQRSGRESSAAVRRNATCKLISQFALAAFVYAAAGGQVRGEGAAVTRGDTATLRLHSSHRTRAHPELTGGWRLLTQHSSQLRDT